MATDQTDRIMGQIRRTALARVGDDLSDEQLLECFLARRDGDAFEVLVRRHGPMVLGVCRRLLHDTHQAEDAFQATFLVLVRKAASLTRRELLGNWLYGVACRTAREARGMMARRRMKERHLTGATEPAAPAAEADDVAAVLDEELGRLPEHYRAAVVLCDLEGRTRREAAKQLGVPDGTLSNRLASARRMLARRLMRRGVTLSGASLAAVLTSQEAGASLPGALIISVTQAATAGAISAPVAALTERVVRAMLLKKLKLATGVLAALVLLGGTARMLIPDSRADGPGKDFQKLEAAETEQLNGTWRLTRRELNDVEQKPMFEYYDWTFEGRKASVHWKSVPNEAKPAEERRASYSCTINPGKSPKEFTVFGDGVLLQCIYRLDGDRLTLCHYGISEIDRPRAFTSKDNGPSVSPLIVWELKRVGEAPAAAPAPKATDSKPEREGGRSQRYRNPPKRPQAGTWPARRECWCSWAGRRSTWRRSGCRCASERRWPIRILSSATAARIPGNKRPSHVDTDHILDCLADAAAAGAPFHGGRVPSHDGNAHPDGGRSGRIAGRMAHPENGAQPTTRHDG